MIKLFSTTGLKTLFANLTNETTSNANHVDRGLDLMNTRLIQVCNEHDWPFLEELHQTVSVASQQVYTLPANVDKVKMVSSIIGTQRYVGQERGSWNEWEAINNPINWVSDYLMYYFVFNNELYTWPVAATSGRQMRIVYRKKAKKLTLEDHTTGTIASVANGGYTVTGTGTAWTAGMAGLSIVINDGLGANLGDGMVYKIASVDSATQITLTKPYQGSSITAGTATYTIGQIPVIPQEYAHMLAYWAAYVYWAGQDNGQQRASNLAQMYNEIVEQMILNEQNRALNVDVEPVPVDQFYRNPNLFITNI